MMKPLTEFDAQYSEVLSAVMLRGRNPQRNERTDSWVTEMADVTFIQQGVPLLTLRDIKPKWACVEAVWFLSGSREISWLNGFGFKGWDRFADSKGHVISATGWQWRHALGVDQLEYVINELEYDPTSRRAVLSSWNPYQVIQGASLNVPCLPMWHFCVVNAKLNLSIFQRSCDLWFGLPADIAGAGLILEMVADHLDIVAGHVAIHIANAHLYEDAFNPAKEILKRAHDRQGGTVPNPRVRSKDPLLDAAMKGEQWVVHDLFLSIEEWYTKWTDGPIRGPKLKVGRAQ